MIIGEDIIPMSSLEDGYEGKLHLANPNEMALLGECIKKSSFQVFRVRSGRKRCSRKIYDDNDGTEYFHY